MFKKYFLVEKIKEDSRWLPCSHSFSSISRKTDAVWPVFWPPICAGTAKCKITFAWQQKNATPSLSSFLTGKTRKRRHATLHIRNQQKQKQTCNNLTRFFPVTFIVQLSNCTATGWINGEIIQLSICAYSCQPWPGIAKKSVIQQNSYFIENGRQMWSQGAVHPVWWKWLKKFYIRRAPSQGHWAEAAK